MALLTNGKVRNFFVGLALLACAVAPALAQERLEQKLKAAYLYRFAAYVEWPEESFESGDGPFVIGVAGSDEVTEQLSQIVAGRHVGGHPVEVRRIDRSTQLDGLHMLYLTGDRVMVEHILGHARGKPLLTVTDSEHGFARGSMVNFVIADNRLRFEVALRRVNTGRLRISSRMLAAAHKVDTRIPL